MKWASAAPIVTMSAMPPRPMRKPIAEDDHVFEDDRERDRDDAERGQRVEPRERRRERGADAERDDDEPDEVDERLSLNQPANRGRENFSNHRTRRMMNGTAFPVIVSPSSRFFQLFGSQIVRRPATIWSATRTEITSNTCVMPPVGKGQRGKEHEQQEHDGEALLAERLAQRTERLGRVAQQPGFELVAELRFLLLARPTSSELRCDAVARLVRGESGSGAGEVEAGVAELVVVATVTFSG